jgi:hypothetical protein
MASQSKGKSSKTVIERPGINWRETSPESQSLILSVVEEATKAPIAELKKAACSALLIFKTTQVWTSKNNGSYHSTYLGLIDSKGKQRGVRTT